MLDALITVKLSLLHMGYIALGPEWQFDKVISPFSRLYLITEGEAWVWHHQQKFTLKPNHLYLIPSFTPSRYHCDTHMTQYFISFLDETLNGLSIFDLASFVYERAALPLDHELMKQLLALNPDCDLKNIDPKVYDNQPNLLSFNQSGQGRSTSRLLETQGILQQLLSRFLDDSNEKIVRQTKAHVQFRTVLNYIHSHLHEKISVDQLANIQDYNVDYFSRQFRQHLGIRPVDYIINKRLERAQLLMTTSAMSLQEIADQVGFSDIYYFSRLFKRRFGMPPGQYRKLIGQI